MEYGSCKVFIKVRKPPKSSEQWSVDSSKAEQFAGVEIARRQVTEN